MLSKLFSKKDSVPLEEILINGALILDVRNKEEFESGHADGAKNIPLAVLEQNISTLGPKSSTIVTCCLSGGRSSVAVSILKKHGYTNVYNGRGWQSVKAAQNKK
jgi:rhodanese-related sulfurtransferase